MKSPGIFHSHGKIPKSGWFLHGKSPKVDSVDSDEMGDPWLPHRTQNHGSDAEKNGVVNFIQLPEDLHGRVLVRKLDVGDLWRCITHLEPHWSRLLQQTGPGTPGRHRNSMAMA